MDKLHITQDDFGFWMLSHEKESGELSLVAHHFATPDHLIENANEMIAEGKVQAVIVIDPPRAEAAPMAAAAARTAYRKPAPRRAGA
jgi:hypothetical protein